jgi:hypothetical protein
MKLIIYTYSIFLIIKACTWNKLICDVTFVVKIWNIVFWAEIVKQISHTIKDIQNSINSYENKGNYKKIWHLYKSIVRKKT